VVIQRHQARFDRDRESPLGRLRLSGTITQGRGVVPRRPLRVYGSYAVMCVLRGAGAYRDAAGGVDSLQAGDAVLVFPELAHWYGPQRGQPGWDEFYVTFDGAIFDHWRIAGLLDPARPVLHVGEATLTPWIAAVKALLERRSSTEQERARDLADFMVLLDSLLRAGVPKKESGTAAVPSTPPDPTHPGWLDHVVDRVNADLAHELDPIALAAELHISYETLRKRFQAATGTTLTRYRMGRRIEAARALLRYMPGITNREVAVTLGFVDEFHFSRRFTQHVGVTPRAFREQLRRPPE